MKYLQSASTIRTGVSTEFQRYVSSDFASTEVLVDPSQSAAFCMARLDIAGVQLYYTEIEGSYVRVATSLATEVTFALITSGKYAVRYDDEGLTLLEGQGCLRLPGELNVQAGTDVQGFTPRIPVDDATLFRLRAWPHRKLQSFSHRLADSECSDLVRLSQFLSLEHERLTSRGVVGDPTQLRVLGQALRARAMAVVEGMTGLHSEPTPEMVRICLAVDGYLRSTLPERHTAEDLARAGLCSLRQLYRAFDEVAGTSPSDYQVRTKLQLIRQEVVKTLDLEADLGLEGLARRFGLSGERALERLYREEFGERPGETRERFYDYQREYTEAFLPSTPLATRTGHGQTRGRAAVSTR